MILRNEADKKDKTKQSAKHVVVMVSPSSSEQKIEQRKTNEDADLLKKRSGINAFYEYIYGSRKKGTTGLKDEFKKTEEVLRQHEIEVSEAVKHLQQQKKLLDDTQKEQKEYFDDASNKYKELITKIENLLPGATAAGLSEAYEKAISEQKENLRKWTNIFYISLSGMVMTFLALALLDLWSFSVKDSLVDTIIKVIRLATFESPVLWLAIVSSKKINQFTMLIEEYRHKWATMRVYDGMRKAVRDIDKEGAENSPEAQLFIELLKTVQKNPTISLDNVKSDNILEQVKDLLNKTSKSVEDNKK